MRDWAWDTETLPNFISLTMIHCVTGDVRVYEISEWVDDTQRLLAMCEWLQRTGARMVGFNSEGFDYPILHALLTGQARSYQQMYAKSQAIIKGQDGNRWGSRVWDNEKLIPQLDLYLVHHFDNDSKRTSLKTLEFNMRSHLVQEMPVAHSVPITYDQRDVVLRYNFHDVAETLRFYWESRAEIEFREELTARYGVDYTNFNDTKLGKSFMIKRLEEANPGCCYMIDPQTGRKVPRQSRRAVIHLADVILPVVQFDEPEFVRIRDWFARQSITETKGVFKDLTAKVRGFTFVFGTGGIHGSVDGECIESDEVVTIESRDVTSYYPSMAIEHRLFPEHLTEVFCDIYADIKRQRQLHKKGTAENAMLKLALNGVYGDSNNQYSPFYDPRYMLSITINGQLLLCMLAEKLMVIPTLRLLMINTDGLEYVVNRSNVWMVDQVCAWWEGITKLTLESAKYSKLAVRDCNNYLGIYEE